MFQKNTSIGSGARLAGGMNTGARFENYVFKNVRRVCRNDIITGVIVILIACGLGFLGRNYFYNSIYGPFPVSADRISAISDIRNYKETFVSFTPDEIMDTGYTRVLQTVDEVTNEVVGEETDAAVVGTVVGDKILLIAEKLDHKGDVYTGSLVANSDVIKSIIADGETAEPDLVGVFLPFYLDENDTPTGGIIVLSLLALFALFGVWKVGRGIYFLRNEAGHPIVGRIVGDGSGMDILHKIDAELNGDLIAMKNLKITRSWFFWESAFDLRMITLVELVWCYMQIISRSINYLPAGTTYKVVLKTGSGEELTLSMGEKLAEDLLNALKNRAPHAVFGYSRELEKLYKENPKAFVRGGFLP